MQVEAVKNLQQAFYPNWNHNIYNQVMAFFDVDPKQKVSALSREERADFNLSMPLAQRPSLLILDEPTLGLDVVARQSFLETLMFAEINNDLTTIYCSHQMEEVERIAIS
jgi:ABC-2 type transport system ATP-binding protein